VIILAINHGDPRLRAAQRLGSTEAAETCSNNHYARRHVAVDRLAVDLAVRFHTL
jgi:hypothetical protein